MRKLAEYRNAYEEKIPGLAGYLRGRLAVEKWKVHSGTGQEDGCVMAGDQMRISLFPQYALRQARKTALIRWRSQ